MRTERIVLTIAHDQPEPPGPSTVEQMARLLEHTLSAAGITATVTAEPFPDHLTLSLWPLGWTCPAEGAEHWPRSMPDPLTPGTPVECGHCGYVQTWTGTAWTDPRP